MSRFRLITGGIGTGKTLWAVEQAFKIKDEDPDRKVYADVTELRHTGIEQSPEDWREIPNNSLIIYDEVQFKELFSRHNSKRDKQILELTTIRKRGIEIWLITQRTRYLNADVLGLVNEHVHLERTGTKTSKVYVFQEAETNITKTKKMFAFDKYVWQYPEHLYGFYKSIQDDAKHHKRSYLNKAVWGIVATLVIAFIFGAFFIKSATQTGISVTNVDKPKSKNEAKTDNKNAQNTAKNEVISDLNYECRKGENVDKPECKQWFDQLSKNNQSVESINNQGQQMTTISYHRNDPYATRIPDQINIQVTDLPRITGCVKFNNRYYAIDQQGNKMDVAQSVCKRWLNGDRPFDYFASSKPSNYRTDLASVETLNSVSKQVNQPNQYANNIVYETQTLTHNKSAINGANAL
ncbi:zonular occludens toxin domain-containing protein [Acinetobacter gerneri]|uniref:zonular occludens toxin domain-containing protein n=1 Tax=Acinetobacter gerneri TaxID=202952 RepID=UPI0028AE8E52|nr:zonular occludens toxin domain-containing protein [Acinetobacter gerneri]